MFASSKKGMTASVAHFRAINDECVVMQTGNKRRRRERPKSIRLFYHIRFGAAPEIHPDLGGVGRFDTKLNPPGMINARILGSPDVSRSGLKLTRLLRQTGAPLCTTKTR